MNEVLEATFHATERFDYPIPVSCCGGFAPVNQLRTQKSVYASKAGKLGNSR